MVRSTPITPAAARAGESHSRPKTWTGNFPAIFWAIALSWSAAMSNCGRFLWLHSEPCSLFPVGLGRNWYFLVQPQKKTSAKPWCDGVKCRHQQRSPPHRCSLFHIHHMLIYHIPPSRKRKRSRRALLPALLAGSVCVEAIDELSESKKEHSSTPLLLMPSEKERSPTPSLLYSSESTKEQSPILLPFLPVESADAPHVEAIVGLPKLMNEQAPIPLPHTKSAKKNDRATVDDATCLGRSIPFLRSIPLSWRVLCIPFSWMFLFISILSIPFFWMTKFSGVLQELHDELMIVNCNGDDENGSTIKGGDFLWRETWARLQFQCEGVIKNLEFLIDREGSMVWRRRKKKMP